MEIYTLIQEIFQKISHSNTTTIKKPTSSMKWYMYGNLNLVIQ